MQDDLSRFAEPQYVTFYEYKFATHLFLDFNILFIADENGFPLFLTLLKQMPAFSEHFTFKHSDEPSKYNLSHKGFA